MNGIRKELGSEAAATKIQAVEKAARAAAEANASKTQPYAIIHREVSMLDPVSQCNAAQVSHLLSYVVNDQRDAGGGTVTSEQRRQNAKEQFNSICRNIEQALSRDNSPQNVERVLAAVTDVTSEEVVAELSQRRDYNNARLAMIPSRAKSIAIAVERYQQYQSNPLFRETIYTITFGYIQRNIKIFRLLFQEKVKNLFSR